MNYNVIIDVGLFIGFDSDLVSGFTYRVTCLEIFILIHILFIYQNKIKKEKYYL